MADPEFLIDSNIAIYVLGDALCLPARKLQTMPVGAVVTSAIVYAEVLRRIPIGKNDARRQAEALFALIPALPFEAAHAATYSLIPCKRHRFDHLIAAHALSLDLTLVTNNEGDFADVPGLKVENWTV
ncbi:MAG: type II toxin-antitoxin system VapC family toxin [Sphingomonadaceae bacterium]|nr:type II toxin-antitoxin system VapC family toxin [Sphingomonadaceae bacterium]